MVKAEARHLKSKPLLLLVWIGLVAFYVPTFVHLLEHWLKVGYDVALLVPLVIGAVVWHRRDALRREAWEGSRWGVPLIVAGLALFGAGQLLGVMTLARISLVPSAAGALVLTGGWQILRVLAIPIALLVLLAPPRTAAYLPLASVLKEVTATASAALMGVFGLPVRQEGSLLHLPGVTLQVTEECTGMRSLVALSAVALAMALTVPMTRVSQWRLLAIVPVVAFVINVVRIVLVGVTSGTTPIDPNDAHVVSNWLAFGTSLLALTLVARGLAHPARSIELEGGEVK